MTALVWVLAPSGAVTAALVCAHLGLRAPLAFLRTHAALMLVVLLLAVMVVGSPLSTAGVAGTDGPVRALLLVGSGLLGGAAAVRAYDAVQHGLRRRSARSRPTTRPTRTAAQPTLPTAVAYVRPDLTAAGVPRSTAVLVHLVVCAVLEELLFRGVLVGLAVALPVAAAVGVLLMTTVLFVAGHAQLGPGNALALLPMSALALALALVTGSVIPAVLTHVALNVRAWWAGSQALAPSVRVGDRSPR